MLNRKTKEKLIKIILVIATLVMTILRFLLNEKGRVSPDSIRFMRTAHLLPEVDNTVAPIGYPLMLKIFTLTGLDEFWSSKIIGILACLAIIIFARLKKFYFKESIILIGLFSFVSLFSATLSENLILPFVFIFLFVSRQIIVGIYPEWKGILLQSICLFSLFSIRYNALFFIGGTILYGFLNFRKTYAKTFMISGFMGLLFIVAYKLLFIDRFNSDYVSQALDLGLKPTSQLISEFFKGIATTFNPFIHIANPGGGMINLAIYGVGMLNVFLMVFIFIRNKLSETEKFIVFTGVFGIICTFFIQYFYVIDPLDYRLLSSFSFAVWLVYFKKLFQIFGRFTYIISPISLAVGFAFIILSKGNYLENRKQTEAFLLSENLKEKPLKFYLNAQKNPDEVQIAELLSTVNPNIKLTNIPKDTLQSNTLTAFKVLKKIKIDRNRFQ